MRTRPPPSETLKARLERLTTDCLDPDPPEVLYHYTDWQGFCGIVKSRTIWHTAHDCTNDPGELRGADDQVRALALDMRGRTRRGDREVLDHFLSVFSGRSLSEIATVYIASHSTVRDNRHAWERYGRDGGGVCLGIRVLPEHFEEDPKVVIGRGLHKVHYDLAIWRARVEEVFSKVLDLAFDERRRGGEPSRVTQDAGLALLMIAARAAMAVKTPDWAEEAEWRQTALVAPTFPGKPLVREARGQSLRYLPLPARRGRMRLALDEVIVGPNSRPRETEVLQQLRDSGYEPGELPRVTRGNSTS
jgi:hypothetical protein